MWLERVQRYLLPGDIENEARFRAQIRRLSYIGMQVVGGIQIAVSVFMLAAYLLVDPDPELHALRLEMAAAMVLLGLLTFAAARNRRLYPHTRMLSAASALASGVILTWALLMMSQFDPTADDVIPGNITLIMLVAVAAIPLRPTDTLLVGFLMESAYVILALAAQEFFTVGVGIDKLLVLYIFMLTCLSAALTAVLYNQRRAGYEWHVRSLQTAENLRHAEARNLLAENAASVGRLAAALAHELNSPIGALISGVDTLLLLASRQATAQASEQQRLVVLQNELRKSIRQSTERLREIVARMQRFTNLDKAEVQAAQLNDLLADVTALVQPAFEGKATVELDLAPDLPELVCRPQQISAVFSSLLNNALEATSAGGAVRIATRSVNGTVQVAVTDNGHGLDARELATIFDPDFKVSHGRVAAGNWSMFGARQIVREHGGDIRIESRKGVGTEVTVVLPLQQQ
jgi:signal transduction histidine kinase